MKKGEKMSESQKAKIRLSNLGKKHIISPLGYLGMSKTWFKGAWNKGKSLSDTHKEHLRQSHLGIQHSEETKTKHRILMTGEKNPRWKGGKLFWKQKDKKHLCSRYKAWMFEVKNRDNWRCKINNSDCCGRLEAHHILPWRSHPELRYEVNNGITLCHFHHPKTNTEHLFVDEYRGMITANRL